MQHLSRKKEHQQSQVADKIDLKASLYTPQEILKAKKEEKPLVDKVDRQLQRVFFKGESYPTNYCFYSRFERSKLRDKQVVGYIEPSSSYDSSTVLVWDSLNKMVIPQFDPVVAGKTYPREFNFKTHWLIEKRIPKNTIIGHVGSQVDFVPHFLLIWNGGEVKRINQYAFNGYRLKLNQLIFPKYHKTKNLREGSHIGIQLPLNQDDQPKLLHWKNGTIIVSETSNRGANRGLSAFDQINLSENYPPGLPEKTGALLEVGQVKHTDRNKKTKKQRRGKIR